MAKLLILLWVSWAGKTSVLNGSGILQRDDFSYVPSYTTRELRPGEVNGAKYHHISEWAFEQAIMRDECLEHATYALNMYGTKKKDVMDVLSQWKNVVKEMEMNGFLQLEEKKDSLDFILSNICDLVMGD